MAMAACMMVFGAAGHAPAADDAGASSSPVAEDELKPAALTLDAAKGEIALDGDLAEGTARRLRVLLRSHPTVLVLSLESDGGLVDEAEQIGDIVDARGLTTVVRGLCVSACTLAYVRGRERLAQSGARLGFHAPWVPAEGGGEQQVPSDDERQAYVAAGIARDFVAEALAVPAESIWFPEEARLLAAGVVTAILAPDPLTVRIARLAEPRRLAAAPD